MSQAKVVGRRDAVSSTVRLRFSLIALAGSRVAYPAAAFAQGVTAGAPSTADAAVEGADYAAALAAQTNGDFIQWAPPRTFGVTGAVKF